MVGLLVTVGALLAVVVMVNWLRVGGSYDDKTVGQIGPEPPGWTPHETEPWLESPTLYGDKPQKDREP